MPRKLRDLRAALRQAGAAIEAQRGSHQKWGHEWVPDTKVVLAGHDSADAKPYQEQQVRRLLERIAEETQKRQQR
jgi:predicted RNA binding protein YcfA (HicA-like mRNA interferase family)